MIVVVWLIVAAVLGLLALSLTLLRSGTASRSEGRPAVARIERTADGECLVGGQREHCFRLHFTVFPKGSDSFRTSLDVNVPDRWASRVQPGSLVWVVCDPNNPREVALAIEAFEEAPPRLDETNSTAPGAQAQPL